MTGGARLARASGWCWVCRGWESGVERHPSRVILLPRVSCLAGVCIYRASSHSLSPKPFSLLSCQRPSLPGPTGMDRAQMEFHRTSGSLLNRVLGVLVGTPKVPAIQVLGHGTGCMCLCAGSTGAFLLLGHQMSCWSALLCTP